MKNYRLNSPAWLLIALAMWGLACGCASKTQSVAPQTARAFYHGITNQSPLPSPTGPFAVGRTQRTLTDKSRNILYRSVTNGLLVTTIWYPAGEIGCHAPGPYVNPREMMAWIELFRQYGQRWDASQIGRLTNSCSFSFPDAPLSARSRKFPVILYVHGQVGLRTDNSGSAEELASHGFVVVSSSHGGTAGMETPDGLMVKPKLEYHLSGNDTNPVAVAVFEDQTRDLRFLIDELSRMNVEDGLFARRLDINRIGVFGFSYGGASAADLCDLDQRCKAGAALDLGGHPDLSKIHVKQPFMILTGGHGVSAGARQLFDHLDRDAHFVKLHNASHAEFGDAAEFLQTAATGRHQILVRKCLVSFFATHLKGAGGHDLDSICSGPDVEVYLKK